EGLLPAHEPGPRFLVGLVGKARPLPRAPLHVDPVPRGDELPHPLGREGHPPFRDLPARPFFGHAELHAPSLRRKPRGGCPWGRGPHVAAAGTLGRFAPFVLTAQAPPGASPFRPGW